MIRLPDYISDHAVLSCLTGESDFDRILVNGIPVPVKDGCWSCSFENGDIVLQDADSRIELRNIRKGLVILAAGQSNMEWPVQDSLNQEEIIRRLSGRDIPVMTAAKPWSGPGSRRTIWRRSVLWVCWRL